MEVTLSQLGVFVALCDTLHFTRAAQRLGLAQPTVSKEIRVLERTVGLQLLARSAGGTTLTPAGKALESHARSVLEAVDSFTATAARQQRRALNRVTIAASPSIVNHLLPETLRRVEDDELGILISALELETGEVVAAVEKGRADIGIGHYLEVPSGVVKRRLGHDELQVLIHKKLLAPEKATVAMSTLRTLPMLMWPRERSPEYYDAMVDVCRERGLEPLILTGTSRISGSWSYFLADARAFALAPRDYATKEARGEVIALGLEPRAFVPLDIVWQGSPSSEANDIIAILWEMTRARRG